MSNIQPRVLTVVNEGVIYVTKQLVVALSIAAVYFGICLSTPSKSVLAGVGVWKMANLLRATVLAFPGAAVGLTLGQHYYNVYTGTLAGAYPVLPIIVGSLGYATYRLSKIWGRSTAKDLALLALYGLLAGTVISLNLVSVGVILRGTVFHKLLLGAVQFKILTNIILTMAGYPLVRIYENIRSK